MIPVTHALTMNGRINTELKDPVDSPEAVIRQRLSLLDGSRRFALKLWAIPGGVALDEVDYRREPREYIQTAGSPDRMSVEVRRIEPGGPGQYVVGRPALPSEDEELPTEVIRWNQAQTMVRPTEIFHVDEVAELFITYYRTGWVPPSCTLRKLDL